MRFLGAFPHTTWEWYDYRERKVKEGVIEGSNDVFRGDGGGKLILFESKEQISDAEVIQELEIEQIYGIDYVVDEGVYVTTGQSCYENGISGNEKILCIDGMGKPAATIESRLFSHLHSVKRTQSGLLLASSGIDLVFEIDLQGNKTWEWWAVDHGYEKLKDGSPRKLEKSQDHRQIAYPTMYQSTHVSQAIENPYEKDLILAVLYHQNAIAEINRKDGSVEVVLDGLKRPHHVRPTSEGFMFTNTRERSVVFCDPDFDIRFKYGIAVGSYQLSNWVQDAIMTSRGTLLIADEGNFRLIETDMKSTHYAFEYGKPLRMFQLCQVPDDFELVARK